MKRRGHRPSSRALLTRVAPPQRSPELCVPSAEGVRLREELAKPFVAGCERSVLALIGLSRTPRADRILIRKIVPIPDDAYFATARGSAWSPLVTGAALSEGLRIQAGLLLIHSHPGSESPRLSLTDSESLELLLPRCIDLLPKCPHGSVVLGDNDSIGGAVWLPGTGPDDLRELNSVRWLGPSIQLRPSPPVSVPRRPALFDRQTLLIGPAGQSMLGRSTIGVIGVGGGGSHVVQQAAHMGIGRIVVIDPDQVEESNLSRLIGATPIDVGRFKTDVMADMAHQISSDTEVEQCREMFPSTNSIELAKTCDLLVSAVDSYTVRNEIQKIAWRHLLPYIDIGFGARPRTDGESRAIEAAAGHVHAYIPGGPCAWCSDMITERKLEDERAGHAVPYVVGTPAPQVVHFNGVLASQAMIEAMQIVTGFLPVRERTGFLVYRGVAGELVRLSPGRRTDCPVCDFELGAGDPVW